MKKNRLLNTVIGQDQWVTIMKYLFLVVVLTAIMISGQARSENQFSDLLPGRQKANNITGNELYLKCATTEFDPFADTATPRRDNGTKGLFSKGYCFGYIQSVVDNLTTDPAISTKPLDTMSTPELKTLLVQSITQICLPPKNTVGQIIDVVKARLQKYPEIRHQSAHKIATQALMKAFPCNP